MQNLLTEDLDVWIHKFWWTSVSDSRVNGSLFSISPLQWVLSLAFCCLCPSCGIHTHSWHAICRRDICVTGPFYWKCVIIIRAAWFACDRALIKRAAGVKNRHNTRHLSLAVSGFILASGLFVTLWQWSISSHTSVSSDQAIWLARGIP